VVLREALQHLQGEDRQDLPEVLQVQNPAVHLAAHLVVHRVRAPVHHQAHQDQVREAHLQCHPLVHLLAQFQSIPKKMMSVLKKTMLSKSNNTMKKNLMRMKMKKMLSIQMTRIAKKIAQNPSKWMMR
jgi:hypothetical protein